MIVFNATLAVIGLALMGFTKSVGVRYFGVFLTCAGANSNIPQAMTYQANNIRGQWKRAFCSATLVGFGGIGGIAGSLIFRSQDSPRYHPGLYGCITAALLTIVTVILLDIKFWFDNKKQAEGKLVIEGGEVRDASINNALSVHADPFFLTERFPIHVLSEDWTCMLLSVWVMVLRTMACI